MEYHISLPTLSGSLGSSPPLISPYPFPFLTFLPVTSTLQRALHSFFFCLFTFFFPKPGKIDRFIENRLIFAFYTRLIMQFDLLRKSNH